MADGSARVAEGRKGTHAAQRRSGTETSGIALGPDQQGISLRYRRRSLADLFRERSQLLVYHFMFGPDYIADCPSCSMIADGFNGFAIHVANHDVTLMAVSRAPLAKLQAYKRRMGWTFPWASSFGDGFNFDFSVGFTKEQQSKQGIQYNYRRERVFQSRLTHENGRRWRTTQPCAGAICPHICARGLASAHSHSKTELSTTPIPLTRAASMDCGECTNGSIALPRGATRRAPGGSATTNTRSDAPAFWETGSTRPAQLR
jgi:hypothetical protein